MKHTGRKIAVAAVIAAVLAGAFFLGGPQTVQREQPTPCLTTDKPVQTEPAAALEFPAENSDVTQEIAGSVPLGENTPKAAETPEILPTATLVPTAIESPTPIQTEEPAPQPSAAETEDGSEERYTCTLSVTCEILLEHLDELDEGKRELVPADGVIFPATEVTFYEGENVFHVLHREMKTNRIHLEFVETPVDQSVYIEGIGNLYELDCGDLSGWVYRVNGSFPGYGCSNYLLQNGDNVEWLYTCDLGKDVGGNNGWGGTAE